MSDWRSAALLMEEETPFGVFERGELDAAATKRHGTSQTHERNARMRDRYDAGDSIPMLAVRFGISERTVLRILTGRTR